ncbi:MAG: type II toxin-antitoxin system HicB family antitoxin, partial [Ruminococcus sp.]|nr:type II toxin-antitoxin system HicB family antitoxin [Ruminococcus sp.]
MAKYAYPAVFTKEDCGYSVNFPDVPSCYTSGVSIASAIDMAEDVLSIRMCDIEDDKQEIPAASEL